MIDSEVQERKDVGVLKSGNLAGLVLKAFEVVVAITCCEVCWADQEAKLVCSCCCIGTSEKDRTHLALSNELFQAIVSKRRPS